VATRLKPFRLQIIVMILAGFIITAFAITKHGQVDQLQERIIKKETWLNEPVKIVKIQVNKSPVLLDRSFLASDDWLKGLTISVQNTSGKTIKYIEIALEFPRTEDQGQEPPSRDHLIYGEYPPLPGENATPHPDQPPVLPGGIVDLVLTDYDGTRRFLTETHYLASIKEVQISLDDIIFDDGTKFNGGQMWHRDPNDSNRWNPDPRQSGLLKKDQKSTNPVFIKASFTYSSADNLVSTRDPD
jgi:hypothetical protein